MTLGKSNDLGLQFICQQNEANDAFSAAAQGYFGSKKDLLVKTLYKCKISFPVHRQAWSQIWQEVRIILTQILKYNYIENPFCHLSQLECSCPWGKILVEVTDLGHLFNLFSCCQEMAVSLHGPSQLAKPFFRLSQIGFLTVRLKKFFWLHRY